MAAKRKQQVETAVPTTVSSVKGFDKDLSCRGHSFEIGKTYSVSGTIEACSNGFHACENPFDVWSYYPLVADDGSLTRYAEVTQSGEISRHDGDSKIASATITVDAEIRLPDFIRRAVSWLIDSTKCSDKVVASSGDSAKLASSGDYAKLASSGDYAKLASSGDSAKLASSGDYAQLASSGHSAQLASSGDSAKLASSGDSAKLASSGDYAKLASSGHSAQLIAEGENSVLVSAAPNASAKGPNGTQISLADFDKNGRCVGFAVGQIGQGGFKPHTFYRAQGGKLVEIA